MTIAFLSDSIYPYHRGGKEKRLFELSVRLAAMGHSVHIYTMHWWASPEKTRIEHGVQLHAISRRYALYRGNRRSIKEGILFALASFKLLFARFDVLDADHMPYFPIFSARIVCWLRRKRLYGTWHEALSTKDWVDYMGKAGYIAALIERISIRLPHHIIAASEQTKRLLATHHYREGSVDLVASGLDTAAIQRTEPYPGTIDVLYVGRLVKDKNVDVLIRAMAQVIKRAPQAQCTIIGRGIEEGRLAKLISQLHLEDHITLVGAQSHAADVYSYMKSAKVFVLPSIREGFGIVVLEALCCGAPVITIDTPANAAKDLIVDTKTGSLVQLDETQIADAILSWLAAGKRLDVNDWADHDWNVLATKLAQIYTV